MRPLRTAVLVILAACSADRALPGRSTDASGYRPKLEPLGWTSDGKLVLRHQEEYWRYDAGRLSCGGSGLYALAMGEKLRPLVSGESWCERKAEFVSMAGQVVFAIPGRVEGGDTLIHAYDVAAGRWLDGERLGVAANVTETAVSPDGRRVAARLGCGMSCGGGAGNQCRTSPPGCAIGTERLWLMDRSGAARRPVGGLEDRQPAWSPDATRLLVLSPNPWRLSIIDTASGRRTVVARGESGAWSPDGRSIAYVRFPEDGRDYRIALHVVGADGRGDRRVFENDDTTTYDNGWGTASNGWPRTPIWSPDGSRIFFIRHHERGGSLWSIAVDGDGLRKEADRIERQSRG